jgi:hypothetical protein
MNQKTADVAETQMAQMPIKPAICFEFLLLKAA